ncbi:MAG: UDP-N-acetylglucosamine 1-carboxyvinyltransferase [Patescibacteria group bacterium]
MPSAFVIEGTRGEKKLSGSIPVYGSKNAVLPLMAAAALVEGETKLSNVPEIADIRSMISILEGLGAFVTYAGDTLSVRTQDLSQTVLDRAAAKSLRASVLLTGPVLARNKSVTFPHPGGDLIGERPVDVFLNAFTKLGATVTENADSYTVSAPNGLTGGEYFFHVVSVTGTESILIAATAATGTVTLKNCAMEPEVVATAEFLQSCGAKIEGAGTPTILITPTSLTAPSTATKVIPDRIEAASFLTLGALLGQDITVTNADRTHLDAVIDALEIMGVSVLSDSTGMHVKAPERLTAARLRTHEYPGYPTDAQSPQVVLLTQATGESVVIESIFDGRLAYTKELVRMGANIELMSPHRAVIRGPTSLTAATIDTPDIRAGLAYMLAAAIASGTSTINNAHIIDRGYAHIVQRLSALGLSIKRVES